MPRGELRAAGGMNSSVFLCERVKISEADSCNVRNKPFNAIINVCMYLFKTCF